MADWKKILPAIGGFLGGAGQFTGGMANLFGGSDHIDRDAIRRNMVWQWQNQMRHIRAGAEAAGIHPLAALGVNMASGPMSRAFERQIQRHGSDFANMGQGLGRVLDAQARLLNAQADKVIEGQADGGIKEENLPAPNYQGIEAGWQPKNVITVEPETGLVEFWPSERIQDSMSEDMIKKYSDKIRRWWRDLTRSKGNLKYVDLDKVRMHMDRLESHMALPPDQYLVVTRSGQPRVVRYKGGKKYLYESKKGGVLRYSGFGSWRNLK